MHFGNPKKKKKKTYSFGLNLYKSNFRCSTNKSNKEPKLQAQSTQKPMWQRTEEAKQSVPRPLSLSLLVSHHHACNPFIASSPEAFILLSPLLLIFVTRSQSRSQIPNPYNKP